MRSSAPPPMAVPLRDTLFFDTAKNGAAISITAQPNEPWPPPPGRTAFLHWLLTAHVGIEILCHILTIVANRFRAVRIGKRPKNALSRRILA